MPKKLWYALLGFVLYSTVNLLDVFGVAEIPEFIKDLAFFQYYIMTMISLLLNFFYSECYTNSRFSTSDAKIEYHHRKQNDISMHIFRQAKPNQVNQSPIEIDSKSFREILGAIFDTASYR